MIHHTYIPHLVIAMALISIIVVASWLKRRVGDKLAYPLSFPA